MKRHKMPSDLLYRRLILVILSAFVSACGVGAYEEPPRLLVLTIESEHNVTSLSIGEQIELRAQGVYSDDLTRNLTSKVSWSTSDSSIISIRKETNDEGRKIALIKALKPGIVTIRASLKDGDNVTEAQRDYTVTPTLMKINILSDDSVEEESAMPLKVIGDYNNKTSNEISDVISWEINPPYMAEVDDHNRLLALAAGDAIITARYRSHQSSKSIKITPRYSSIDATMDRSHPQPGDTITITTTATTLDSEILDVTSLATLEIKTGDTLRATRTDNEFLVIKSGAIAVLAVYRGREVTVSDNAIEPIHIHLEDSSPTSMTLKWNEQSDETTSVSYNVYWDTNADVDISDNMSTVTEARFIHDNIDFDQMYYYRISTVTDAGESPLSAVAKFKLHKNTWRTLPGRTDAFIQDAAQATIGNKTFYIGGHYRNSEAAEVITNRHELLISEGSDTFSINDASTDFTAVTGASACSHNGLIYLFGGRTPNGYSKSIRVYDPDNNSWSAVLDASLTEVFLTQARAKAGCAVIGNDIYVLGGKNDSGALSSMDIFNTQTTEVTTGSAAPSALHSFRLHAFGNRLFALGGENRITLNTLMVYDADTGLWDDTGYSSMTVGRSDFTSFIHADRIYVFGGFNDVLLRHAEVYDLTTNSWSELPEFAEVQMNMSFYKAGNNVYFIGGVSDLGKQLSTFRYFNLATHEMFPKRTLEEPHYSYNSAYKDGKIYVFGGVNKTNDVSLELDIYDVKSNTWSKGEKMKAFSSNQHLRFDSAVAIADNHIYVLGGETNPTTPGKTLQRYSIRDNTWEEIYPGLPVALTDAASCTYRDSIYLFGGTKSDDRQTGVVISNETRRYDYIKQQWHTLKAMPNARAGLRCEVIDDELYVMGGAIAGRQRSNEVYVYTPLTNSWRTITPMNHKRAFFSSTVMNGDIYVFGGLGNDNVTGEGTFIDSVEKYSPLTGQWTEQSNMSTPTYQVQAHAINGSTWLFGGRDSLNRHQAEFKTFY